MSRLLITLLVGSLGGVAGNISGIPAGALLGSMLAVGIYNCLGFQSFMHPKVRVGTQIIVGSLLGSRLNPAAFMELRNAVIPALIIVTVLLIWGVITGFIVYKFCKLDMYTSFLSSSAGGLTELGVLAATLGGDGPKVVLLHTIRLITVISVTPVLLHVLEKLIK